MSSDWRSSLREGEEANEVAALDAGILMLECQLIQKRKRRRAISLRVMQRSYRDKQKGVDTIAEKT